MPAAIPIVINDGATVPVAHTFNPIGKDEKGVLWFEQGIPVASSPLEAKKIGFRIARANMGTTNGVTKVVCSLALPALETLGNNSSGFLAAPTLAYRTVCRLEFDLPERGTSQQRKDLRALMLNMMATAALGGVIDTLIPIY